jgi:hypothetical protein
MRNLNIWSAIGRKTAPTFADRAPRLKPAPLIAVNAKWFLRVASLCLRRDGVT